MSKSREYWEGWDAEIRRQRAAADRAAGTDYADLAAAVGRQLGRDRAHKERIVARSPGVFAAMDTEELGAASSRELAARELRELGIEVGDNDPVALLDAHHSGRDFARRGGQDGRRSSSGALDSAGDTFIDRYTRGD